MTILAYGEVMMRLTPPMYKRLSQTDTLDMSFSGTGLNILAGLAQNGFRCELLTALPQNSAGHAAKSAIQRLNVGVSHIVAAGEHIGTYFLEMGYGSRPSEVTYLNRSESAFNHHRFSEEALKKALSHVKLVHICGIALATSEISRQNALKLCEVAKALNVTVAFDFNYRMHLNDPNNRAQLIADYQFILKHAQIVFGGSRDLLELLQLSQHQDETLSDLFLRFVEMYDLLAFSGTEKKRSSHQKQLQGFLVKNGRITKSKLHDTDCYDRIGTGDAFAAGILQGILSDWSDEKTVEYASVAAELAYTTYGDSLILPQSFIERVMTDDGLDVIR